MPDEQSTPDLEPARPLPPRVALIASPRTVAEYPPYLKFLLVGLADEGVPVLFVCPPRLEIDSLVSPAVEVVRHPAIDIALLECYNRRLLLQQLDKFRPDVLHCLCEMTAPLTRWLARHLDIPYLLNVNSIVSRFRLLSLSPGRCAAIIAPAKTIADSFIASHPKFADRLHQINIGVFVESKTACFARPEHLPGVVIVPPLDNQADLQNLYLALHRLVIDGFRFMVAIVSAGRAETAMFKQLRSLGLLRFVTVVPRQLGLYSVGSAADIFIAPRPSSSFNMHLLTAMSAGSIVVACKGGIDDLVIEGKTALTFNPDDQLSIYNTLKRIFGSPLEARQIAYEAQQHLRQSHHVSVMVASTLSLYRQTAQVLLPQTKSPAA